MSRPGTRLTWPGWLTAGLLHKAGLISYRRGVITIEDRQGLEEAACDCYRIIRDEFDELAKASRSIHWARLRGLRSHGLSY